MVNGILIRAEPIRAGLLFGPPLHWRIAVNATALHNLFSLTRC
jgi:hypothetical protein